MGQYIIPIGGSAVTVLIVLLVAVSLFAVSLLLLLFHRSGKLSLPVRFSDFFGHLFYEDGPVLLSPKTKESKGKFNREVESTTSSTEKQGLAKPAAEAPTDRLFSLAAGGKVEPLPATAILSTLDLGIVAYGADGRILFSNEPATRLLGEDGLPADVNVFMGAYCDSNGMMARILLGKDEASGLIRVGATVIRLRARVINTGKHYRKTTVFVLQDITRQELQEQKRKEFVANVSHELKTPLTTIITYSESLLDWGLEEKKREVLRNDITRIHDDAKRMQALVTDLLLLSSIDSEALHMRMESLDLGTVVKQAVERFHEVANQKEIDLSCAILSILPPVFGDRTSLGRIVSNLVSNAIKYSDLKGTVKVYVGMVHDEAYVKVTDDGYGIDEKHLSKIFDRFYRVDMTGSRMYGGTGLGLSIVRELVDMHAGQITVKSAVGSGTSFTVLLPLARTVHNKTLTILESGGTLRNHLQQASFMEIESLGREAGLWSGGATELNPADLTADDLKRLREIVQADAFGTEEIIMDSEMDNKPQSIGVEEL